MPVLIAAALVAASPGTGSRATDVAAAAYANRQSLALTERPAAAGWTVEPSGLRWRRVKGDGLGRHATPADQVTAHYAGTLADGTEFDSSYKRGEPIVFPSGKVIAGWQEALRHAGVGDTLEVAIPYQLAYGAGGKGPIPGGATLLFTIELLAVDPSGEQP